MFFQEPTPDTSGYMIAGYAITFLVMALYVASIYLRSRNLKQDMTILQEMDQPAPTQTKAASPVKKSPTKTKSNKPTKSVTKRSRKK
jgi:hypothetical protein